MMMASPFIIRLGSGGRAESSHELTAQQTINTRSGDGPFHRIFAGATSSCISWGLRPWSSSRAASAAAGFVKAQLWLWLAEGNDAAWMGRMIGMPRRWRTSISPSCADGRGTLIEGHRRADDGAAAMLLSSSCAGDGTDAQPGPCTCSTPVTCRSTTPVPCERV